MASNVGVARCEVVDAFGHVSIRDPENPKRYVMARPRSPELVEYADLIRFEQDGRSLDPDNRTLYGERMIHGAIYETRSDVNAVVHIMPLRFCHVESRAERSRSSSRRWLSIVRGNISARAPA